MRKFFAIFIALIAAVGAAWVWRDRLPTAYSQRMEQAVAMVPGLPAYLGVKPAKPNGEGSGRGQGTGGQGSGGQGNGGQATGGERKTGQANGGQGNGGQGNGGQGNGGNRQQQAAADGGQPQGNGGGQRAGGRNQRGGGAPMVKTIAAERSALPFTVKGTGWAEADETTTIAAQQAGLIISVAVADGADVKEGDVIAKIDDRTARATIEKDKAILARDMATLNQAETELVRRQSLVKGNAASQDTADQAKASRDTAAATVKSDQATLAADEIVLEKTEIRAPFDGRLGAFAISRGAYVNAGTAVVTIVKFDPIFVSFHLPEGRFELLRKAMAAGPVEVEARLLSADAKTIRGTLSFLDNAIDQSSGTLMAKARFANADGGLWPGRSVEVTVDLPTAADNIVLPTVAVSPGASGPFVYVVADGAVHVTPVKLGRSNGDMTEIASGLNPGARVVVEGQVQLTDGQRVNEQTQAADLDAKPARDGKKLAMGETK